MGCAICGLSEAAHESLGTQHAYTETGELRLRELPKPQPTKIAVDVVLRLALLNAGVITSEDLTEASRQLS